MQDILITKLRNCITILFTNDLYINGVTSLWSLQQPYVTIATVNEES